MAPSDSKKRTKDDSTSASAKKRKFVFHFVLVCSVAHIHNALLPRVEGNRTTRTTGDKEDR